MNLDKDFDEIPLYSKILDELYQGGDGLSADEAITLIRKQRSEYCLDIQHFVEYLQTRGTIPSPLSKAQHDRL